MGNLSAVAGNLAASTGSSSWSPSIAATTNCYFSRADCHLRPVPSIPASCLRGLQNGVISNTDRLRGKVNYCALLALSPANQIAPRRPMLIANE